MALLRRASQPIGAISALCLSIVLGTLAVFDARNVHAASTPTPLGIQNSSNAQSDEEVLRLLESAVDGNASAQLKVGAARLSEGDYEVALFWLQEAAGQGSSVAQALLGAMHAGGTGVPRNLVEAAKWYRLAAEQGLVIAQSRLGRMYAAGGGVTQDYVEAIKWLKPASEAGDAEAQVIYGPLLCVAGRRCDVVEEYKWLNLGASRLSGEAQQNAMLARDALARDLTPRQLLEAQKRAREWQQAFDRSQR